MNHLSVFAVISLYSYMLRQNAASYRSDGLYNTHTISMNNSFSRSIIYSALLLISSLTAGAQTEFADSLPRQWTYASDMMQTLPAADRWWDEFNDPTLTGLISRGIDNNFNVAIAMKRMEMARQTIRQSKAAYYPQLSASAGWNISRSSGNITSPTGPAETMRYFQMGVDMNWEIDLFGKIKEQVKESKANYRASHADYIAVMNSLSAQIATTYLQIRTLQSRLSVAKEHLSSQADALKIAQVRHEVGLVAKLDVAQATTVYKSTEATIPQLETQILTSINALALLVGVYPEELNYLQTDSSTLPDYRRIVAIGVPMDLIRRRPDLQQAEAEMAAAAAKAGIAKKDFLPTVTLEGSIGLQSRNIKDFFDSGSFTYSIAPKISWTIFDGLARNAALASARENMHIAIDSYNLALLTAVQEADNAMASYSGQLRTINSLEEVVAQAKEQMDMSLDLYKQGLSDYLNVAQSQITYLQYADQLVSAKGEADTDLVNLYKAIGGGWNNNDN